MNTNPDYPLYGAAVTVAAVGAVWLGVPVSTLALLGLLLACPLMMMLMMRAMHGDDHGQRSATRGTEDPNPHDSASHR